MPSLSGVVSGITIRALAFGAIRFLLALKSMRNGMMDGANMIGRKEIEIDQASQVSHSGRMARQ